MPNLSSTATSSSDLDGWRELINTQVGFYAPKPHQTDLRAQFFTHLQDILKEVFPADSPDDSEEESKALLAEVESAAAPPLSAINTWKAIVALPGADKLFLNETGNKATSIALAPATDTILENLTWFKEHFDTVLVGDNIKKGQCHCGITLLSLDDLALQADTIDCFAITTDTPELQDMFRRVLPAHKTCHVYDLRSRLVPFMMPSDGMARAKRLVAAIEASENPLIQIGKKLHATTEPIFAELSTQDFDVFSFSLFDRMEDSSAFQKPMDDGSPVEQNALLVFAELLYLLKHIKRGRFWIYYDFFLNVGWDTQRAASAYAFTAALMRMANRPVVLGMYDVIKPVYTNMEKQIAATHAYKCMVNCADALALTSKSDHMAEYLRNTLAKDTPVKSFYRYSYPPQVPNARMSESDGERHFVGVTSFLGEVYEPNRIETRNSIRSMLQQKIHFHYYSSHEKVYEFQQNLPDAERVYFHMETPIWDQSALIQDMSRFDAGWLVGDEATIFADMIRQIEDRYIREIYTLFVPNGVPTSSMAYGAAGLPVFISRQIKVMTEVYPDGCCIPLDMGEVGNLSAIANKLDWDTLHQKMRNERHRFDISHQIKDLASFLEAI